MLEEEDELDPELFSVDSGHLLRHLNMDEGTENLVRLPLDLLIKFRKASWLARQWLVLYDRRTHDLQDKLNKVKALESKLTHRLRHLDADITVHERQLERQTSELHHLMEREQRDDVLNHSLYDTDVRCQSLTSQLNELKQQRDVIARKVSEVRRILSF
jgi:DNA repair exonuclease SbcCD ATPase subunit